jgi:hypothetical protein
VQGNGMPGQSSVAGFRLVARSVQTGKEHTFFPGHLSLWDSFQYWKLDWTAQGTQYVTRDSYPSKHLPHRNHCQLEGSDITPLHVAGLNIGLFSSSYENKPAKTVNHSKLNISMLYLV